MKNLVVIISLHFLIFYNGISKAQWVQTNLLGGGIVTCLAVNGTNIFAGTQEEGLYLSTNNGTTWTQINNGLPIRTYTVYALVFIGTNIFAGIGSYSAKGGVYLSTDNGGNWTRVSNDLPDNIVRCLRSEERRVGKECRSRWSP